eukprot:scaffold177270_cov30-Tisochrysis_lutea.AAC.2
MGENQSRCVLRLGSAREDPRRSASRIIGSSPILGGVAAVRAKWARFGLFLVEAPEGPRFLPSFYSSTTTT